MRAFAVAIVLLVGSPSVASAYCVSYPDNASTGYVENGAARAVCQQMDLGQQTDEIADRARLNALINGVELEMMRQRQYIIVDPGMNYAWPRY